MALWLWHTPTFIQAALDSGWARNAQHLGLLASAFIFSDSLIRGQERRLGHGATLLYLFTACAQTMMLGALVADATAAWVSAYQSTTAFWGRTSLEDQQLGGMIIWASAIVAYSIAGLSLFIVWLRGPERTPPTKEDAILMDTDLWISREWMITRQNHAQEAK